MPIDRDPWRPASLLDPHDQTTVGIVVPAQDAAAQLRRALPAILAVADGADVVVVDAGSRDDTAEVAAGLGARVVRLPDRAGPSWARNAGAAQVKGSVLLFIDADCVPRPDVVVRVREAFAADPGLVSLTGCYTADAAEPDFISQYMNLRHHFTHQTAQREPATFWTGCGAVRRDAFQAAGGFDVEQYPNGMEDMELGLRLQDQGRTGLDPDLQVTHLKRWTLRGLVEAEVYRRAVPWARLILERGHLPDDLNVRLSQRVAALVAPLALLAVGMLPGTLVFGTWPEVCATLGVLLLSAVLNLPMLRLFARRRGLSFAARAWLFHQVHLVYSAGTLIVCVLLHPWRRGRMTATERSSTS